MTAHPRVDSDFDPPTDQTPTTLEAAAAKVLRLPSIAGYEVLGVIGRGGMGVVYRARQLSPRRIVALKMLLAGGGTRFQAEVAAVARLQHQHVVTIHEVGESNGRPYFSMEFVDGGTLATLLRAGPLPPRDAADLISRLARAVQHAHDKGIVHRDLKPANVLLAKATGVGQQDFDLRSPKIADFGVAKHLESSGGAGPMTHSGAILGTPSYMSPEQARGKSRDVGPAVDVYALGAVLYECLSGRPPFKGNSTLETIRQVMTVDPEPPRRLRANVPRDLEVICLKCLRKDPSDRYPSAEALAADLDRFLAGKQIAARGRSIAVRASGWSRRNRGILLAVVGAAVVMGVALAFVPARSRPTPPPAILSDPANEPLPADLRLVPPNAFAFVTIQPAELWSNPAALGFVDQWEDPVPREGANKRETFAGFIEQYTSLRPSAISRATIVMVEPKGSRDPLIILSTRETYTPERLETFLTGRKRHKVELVGERRIYTPTESKHDQAFFLVDDHTLLLGDPEDVKDVANNPDRRQGAFAPVLHRAAENHTLVVGCHPSTELVGEIIAKNLSRNDDSLVAVQTLNVVVDAGPPEQPGLRVPVSVEAWGTFPDASQATTAQPHIQSAVDKLLTDIIEKNHVFPPEMTSPILSPLTAAEWTQENTTVRAKAQTVVPVLQLQEHFTEQKFAQQSQSNLQRIARALQAYERANGRLPPAVVTDAAGKPLYSWRVLLLPYLGGEAVYRRFHLNRAWDHPSNKPLLNSIPDVFANPMGPPGSPKTPYQVLLGQGGFFDTPLGRRLAEATDGVSQTLLVVEATEPVPWSQPSDVIFPETTAPKLGSTSRAGFYCSFADGTARFIRHDTATPAVLRGLFTRAGKEPAINGR